MNYQVEITGPAKRDVRKTVRYLRSRSESGASAWRHAFGEMLGRLAKYPESFGLAPENGLFVEAVRHLLFCTKSGRRHRAVFIVRDDTVYVLRIRGPGQNLLSRDQIDLP